MNHRVTLGICVLSGAALIGVAVAAAHDPLPPTDDPLASLHAPPIDFDGTLEVEWQNGDSTRRETLDVSSRSGVLTATSGDRVYAATVDGLVLTRDDGWTVLSEGVVETTRPSPTSKYVFTELDGPELVGRPTRVVVATLPGADHPTQRVVVDREHEFVLERSWYDDQGSATRTVRLTHLTLVSGREGEGAGFADASTAIAPEPLARLDEPYTDPSVVGRGFVLVGRLDHGNGLVQLLYSDGLATASVFQEPGTLDPDALPAAFEVFEIDGHSTYEYLVPSGRVLVWEDDGVVYTEIGDASRAELAAVAEDVDDDGRSLAGTITHVLVEPFML